MTDDNHDIAVRDEFMSALTDMQYTRLIRMGVQVSIQHFSGVNRFPTEYTLRYRGVEASAPTMDMAVAEFIKQLLKYVPDEHVH
jgi:hypothetical protein